MTTTEIINAIVGILGSLASFYGAYLSIQAKNEAKTSAEQAESAKNQVIKKQTTTHLAELLYQAKRVQQSFGKYSITQNKGLIGAEFEKDAEVLQTYIFLFNDNRALVGNSTDIETESTYTTLNELLENFTKHKATEDKKNFGKQIRLAVDDIIFKLKKVIDDRNSEIR
jgi:hypothetical protein